MIIHNKNLSYITMTFFCVLYSSNYVGYFRMKYVKRIIFHTFRIVLLARQCAININHKIHGYACNTTVRYRTLNIPAMLPGSG
jgi:hypothetical protein